MCPLICLQVLQLLQGRVTCSLYPPFGTLHLSTCSILWGTHHHWHILPLSCIYHLPRNLNFSYTILKGQKKKNLFICVLLQPEYKMVKSMNGINCWLMQRWGWAIPLQTIALPLKFTNWLPPHKGYVDTSTQPSIQFIHWRLYAIPQSSKPVILDLFSTTKIYLGYSMILGYITNI